MKKSFLLVVFSGLALLAYAQDVPALYTAVSGSVVYLQHEILLSSTDCTNPELWKRFEKLTKRPVLDAGWPLMSGSGFFLDNDGTILTNRHVLKIGDLKVVRRSAIQSMAKSLDKNFSSDFSPYERATMERDFEDMISKGRYSFDAMLGAQNLGAVTILTEADDNEPDLALVKAVGGPFRGIKLSSDSIIVPDLVGTEVFSFGYPLGSELEVLFQERTVTMNRGSISAFRRTELSLQHSAAISHGNSGGPLVNIEGLALGVNTAGLQEQEGNSLFYAIDVGKVREFLSKKGFGNLLLWNQRLPNIRNTNSNLKLNPLGEIECSSDVVLDLDKNVDVFLDGTKVGSGPVFLHLINPVSSLELHGQAGDFSAKLRLLSSMSGSSTLKPALVPQGIPVTINSNPSGASVIADGKNLGETPLNITLTADKYAIQLRKEGLWYEGIVAEIRAGQTNDFALTGQTAYPITLEDLPPDASVTLRLESKLGKATFKGNEKVSLPTGDWNLSVDGNDAFAGVVVSFQVRQEALTLDLAYPVTLENLPPDATLRFESKFGKATFKGNEKVSLPTGDWNLSIDGNDAFSGVTVPVQVRQEPVKLDLARFRRNAQLKIMGFDSRAKLWIDEIAYPNLTVNAVLLPVGVHTVFVWEDGLQPLDKVSVNVSSDNSSSLTWNRKPGHDVYSTWFTWGGAGGGAIGALLVGLGLYGSQNSVAMSQTHSYQHYVSYRTTANIEIVSGGVLLIGAVAAEVYALVQRNMYEVQRRYLASLESK